MEIKHLTSHLNDITSGDIRDDAQYISLFFENSNRHVNELFFCKLSDGTEYKLRLFGKTEIVDSEGHIINDCKIYLQYIKDGKKNLINYNRTSGIEVLGKNNKIENVFTSIHDCFDYLNKLETKN